MNKISIFLVALIVILSFCLGSSLPSKAEEKSYKGIIPFATHNDRIGFLDQNNGKVYVYDNDIAKCVFVGQIQNLGDPIDVISKDVQQEVITSKWTKTISPM